MPNHYSPYSVASKFTMRRNGAIVVGPLNYSFKDGITTSHTKSSVNTGKFVPGIYRVNPYSVSKQEIDNPLAVVTVISSDGYYTYEYIDVGQISGRAIQNSFGMFPPVSYTNMKKAVLQKAASNVGAGVAQLGEDLFEFKQTLSLLKSPLSGIANYLRYGDRLSTLNWLLSGESRSGGSFTRTAVNRWLQFRYGWTPLVLSAKAVCEVLAKKAEHIFQPSKIYSAKSSYSTSSEVGRKSGTPFGYHDISYTPNYRCTENAVISARVQYRRNDTPTAYRELGLSPEFAPELAWNLTHLSFVVDWFATIGPWLGSMRIMPSIQVLGNTVGVKTVRQMHLSLDASYLSRPTPIQRDVMSTVQTVTSYNREVGLEIPSLPVFTGLDRLGMVQTIDGICLILQGFLQNIRR